MTGRALIIDVEATCTTPEAQATELGWCEVFFNEKGRLQPKEKPSALRCKPEIDITFGAMAVTGIYPEDLVAEPLHSEVLPSIVTSDFTYLIGHNIDYDAKVLINAGVVDTFKRICTLALVRYFYPKDTDHKLTSMLHMLDYEYAKANSKNAHSAKHDVGFCGHILRKLCGMYGITSMEQLYELSEIARIPLYAGFGKHRGKHIHTEIPFDYKTYMLSKDDLDPFVRIAFENSVAQTRFENSERARLKAESKANQNNLLPLEVGSDQDSSQSVPPNLINLDRTESILDSESKENSV